MKIKVEKVGEERFITLDNERGLTATFCTQGAAVYDILFHGRRMCVAPKDLDIYLEGHHYGKTVGRIAGRVKGGRLAFRGEEYQMPQNEGNNCLHSGKDGFSKKSFAPEIRERADESSVCFSYLSKAGESGLPGNVRLKVTYTMYDDRDAIRVDYEAESDAPTPLGLTNHLYYNIGGERTINNHLFALKASKVCQMDEEQIPEDFVPVSKIFDFRDGKRIGEDINDPVLLNSRPKGYDHIFLLDGHDDDEAVATMSNKGTSISLRTDFPCLLLYTVNGAMKGMRLTSGYLDCKHSAATMEWCEIPGDFEGMAIAPGKPMHRFAELSFEGE